MRVGSVTTAASARIPASMSARVPMLSYSSSATAATITSPSRFASTTRSAAAHIAATPAFISDEPRPYTRPSRTSASHGAWIIPSTPTVSRCPLNSSARAPARPMRATTLGRPATASWISTRNPQRSSVCASACAHADSPGPSLTRDGFRESIATRVRVSATASPRAGVAVMSEAEVARSQVRQKAKKLIVAG